MGLVSQAFFLAMMSRAAMETHMQCDDRTTNNAPKEAPNYTPYQGHVEHAKKAKTN
jgi:hypothetical protein